MAKNKEVRQHKEIAESTEAAPEVNNSRRKPVIIISSVALALVMIGCIIVGAIGFRFDYEKRNISRYISVPEALYTSFDVKIDIPEITEFDINEEIVKLLYEKRIVPEGPIYSYKNVTISAGDVVHLYCRG